MRTPRTFLGYILLSLLSHEVIVNTLKNAVLLLSVCSSVAHASGMQKVIYGADNRQEVRDYSNPAFRAKAQAVAGMVQMSDLNMSSENNILFDLENTLERSMRVCADERFADQATLPVCSGFLVAPDILVTAGHCITGPRSCSDFAWVFDYVEGTEEINPADVYRCKEIIGQRQTLGIFAKKDYAVIRLDRRSERQPLAYRKSGKIDKGESVLVIGHPSGLPMKIADGAEVRVTTWNTFRADLDTYGGNSGSPVLNERTGLVEGILVSGAQDYVVDRSGTCMTSERLSIGKARDSKERAHKITKVPELQ